MLHCDINPRYKLSTVLNGVQDQGRHPAVIIAYIQTFPPNFILVSHWSLGPLGVEYIAKAL